MRIAQLVPYYAPVIGGVEVVCQYISEELVNRGHEVHVFTSNRNHKGSPHLRVPREEIINGVKVHRFRSYVNVGHYGLFPGFVFSLMNRGFDIIHAHGYRQPQSEIGSRIGAMLSIPTILHVHGGFYTPNRLKGFLYNLYDSLARKNKVNRFGHYIVLSESDQQRLLALNVNQNNTSIIRNAAEVQSFDAVNASQFKDKYDLHGKRVILYLGILHHYKRPDLMIRALLRIKERVPEAFLLFAGPDAGEFKKMCELGEKLGLAKSYRWVGPLRGKEKHEAIECSEFLALPSDEDPYPLVLLEAMAHGKPVLTTSVVGQAGVIAVNEAGIIVEPADLGAIEEGAIRLLTDAAFNKTTGGNARRLAEKIFSVESAVDEIETLYSRMLEAKITSTAAGSSTIRSNNATNAGSSDGLAPKGLTP